MARSVVALVDDQRTNLAVLERLARGLSPDVEVRSYMRGLDALSAFDAEPPDLVVTDFIMPGMNGATFIRTLRTMPQCADIPVIVITAYEDKTLRYEALDAGATDYLISPIDALEFRARSNNLLTLRAQQKMLKHHAAELERRLVDDAARHRSELRQSHDLLLRMIDAVPVAISATGADGRIAFANRHFLELFDLTAEAVIGAAPDAVLPPAMTALWAGEAEAGHRSTEIELPARSGKDPRHLRLERILLPGTAAQGMLAVTVLVDVSQHKHAELAMLAAKEMAEAANRTKTEFLANMSHELRTPLNAIIGFSELMMRELGQTGGKAEHVDYMNDILSSGRMLLGVVNNVLDLSKIEAGAVNLEEQDIDIPRLIQGVLQMLRGWAPVGSADVQFTADADLPRLRGDPQRLRQILLNLLSNAAKFSATGARIEVTAGQRQGSVVVAVRDEGIGMTRDEIAVAVTRFGQVASPWTRAHPGTGLGLPIAIRLAELHGAELTIDSEKGRGTVVTVVFPANRTIPITPAPTTPAAAQPPADPPPQR